jgi:glycerol-3-phosphate acyltransferase PlsY
VLHKASLASLVCTVAFPVAVVIGAYAPWEIAIIGCLAVLVVARHAANIRRLLRREEADLGSPSAA